MDAGHFDFQPHLVTRKLIFPWGEGGKVEEFWERSYTFHREGKGAGISCANRLQKGTMENICQWRGSLEYYQGGVRLILLRPGDIMSQHDQARCQSSLIITSKYVNWCIKDIYLFHLNNGIGYYLLKKSSTLNVKKNFIHLCIKNILVPRARQFSRLPAAQHRFKIKRRALDTHKKSPFFPNLSICTSKN